MGSLIGHMDSLSYLLQGATATENGDSLNLTGAVRGILLVDWEEDPGDPSSVYTDADVTSTLEGRITVEVSRDGGTVWTALSCVRELEYGDSGPTSSVIDASQIPAILSVSHLTGQALLRTRVSSAFEEPVSVRGVAVGFGG